MGGINSLSGLNTVNVDFRPTIETNVPNATNANQPQQVPDLRPDAEPQPVKTNARSVVQQLDVLLLNAAGNSVAADGVKRMDAMGKALVKLGVITQKDADKLVNLAKDASAKLNALDKFSGREIAKALMTDKKSGELVWGKGFFGMNSTAKAVKAAVEAQEAFSEALNKFNDLLAGSKNVNAALQDAFTEMQFQCDRRATEIYSISVRMHDLVQQDVVNGADADPQVAAYLDAKFNELMPREAILMHGTAEALQKMNDTMGPLVSKLADFAANGGNELGAAELAAVRADMATMKNAIENVRKNGLEVGGGRTEVDRSLLNAMEKILEGAENQLADAKKVLAMKTREAFIREIRDSLSPEIGPSGTTTVSSRASGHSVVQELISTSIELVKTLVKFKSGELPMSQFDEKLKPCLTKFKNLENFDLENMLPSLGFDPAASKQVAKMVGGMRLVMAQFKEMMASTERMMKGEGDFGIATGDVRRILLGEKSISSLVEAKARGFKPGDVSPAADDANIVGSKMLGAGSAGTTYLLTTKSGEELVFKPEMDSRLGLDEILLGMDGAYLDSQKTANLNLATQDTAKAFGCEDVVVKYSVGNHDGQFGFFMEKAKGVPGSAFSRKTDAGGGGVPPAEMHKIADPAEQTRIKGTLAQKLNRLMWLDLITGQGDRHSSNYFVHVDTASHEPTVNAIDNDASFSANRIGLMKFKLDKAQTARYEAELKDVCQKVHGRGWKAEFDNRVSKDPAILRDGDTMTIDLTRAQSHETKMAIIRTLGLQSVALPEEIDKDFYDHLIAMDEDPAKKKAYLDSIAPRISPDALRATEARLDEAIAHARKLAANGKVYGKAQWQNEDNLKAMTGFKATVTIRKTDGSTVKVDNKIECVSDYNQRKCPSFFKREFFHKMFDKPE